MSAHSERLLHEKELVGAAAPAKVVSPHRARRNDPASLQLALHENYPGLVSLLVRRIGDRQLAQDVLHDAIVTALSRLEAGSPVPPDVLAGFVFRTAMNHLRNRRRQERLRVSDDTPVERIAAEVGEEPAEQSRQASMRELVRHVLQGLSSNRDREMLVRYYLDEEDKLQICESFAMTGAQFDRVIFRARDRMRALVERSGCNRWDVLGLALLVFVLVADR